MPPSLRFLLLGLPLLSGLYACKLDTRLPETPVTCGPRGECPSGTQCRASLNRCFTLSNDVEAPQFTVAPTVTPTTGRLDTEFSVSFSV